MSGESLGQVAFEAIQRATITREFADIDFRGTTDSDWESAAAAVVAAHEAGKWRKVEEFGYPASDEEVMFTTISGTTYIGSFYDDEWIVSVDGSILRDGVVTHWAALPAPPEGGTR